MDGDGVSAASSQGSSSSLSSTSSSSLASPSSSSPSYAAAKHAGKVVFDVGGELNAISASPDQSRWACAGRSVFKILQYDADAEQWHELANLRGRTSTLMYSSLDVKWHPMPQFIESVATAPTNGAVVLWNVSFTDQGKLRTDSKKLSFAMKEHSRAVNRVAWHRGNGYLLLSGSQDATVKVWDTRSADASSSTLRCGSEVRDLCATPHAPHNQVAVALENGTVQIWDLRQTAKPELQIVGAHQGYVLSAQWHPHGDRPTTLATGGRDGQIKVWDIQGGSVRMIGTMQTLADGVGRVAWRPLPDAQALQVLSAASVTDYDLHVWDMRANYVPLCSLSAHQDVVTDVDWLGSRHVVSCGKDGLIIRHDIARSAVSPASALPSSALSWNIRSQVASVAERVDRGLTLLNSTATAKQPLQPLRAFGKDSRFVSVVQFDKTADRVASLAERYTLYGRPAPELCRANAQEAAKLGLSTIAQSWNLFQIFVEERVSSTELKPEIAKDEPETPLSYLSASPGLIRRGSGDFSPAPFSDLNPDFKIPLRPQSPSTDQFLDDDVISLVGPISQSLGDTLLEPLIPSESEPLHAAPIAPPFLEEQAGLFTTYAAGKDVVSLLLGPPDPIDWLRETLVFDILRWHVDEGDVQTAVSIYAVCFEFINSYFDEDEVSGWFSSYLELLHRLQLHCHAAAVAKHASLGSIRDLSRRSTSLNVSCSRCGKPNDGTAWFCKRCSREKFAQRLIQCAVCHEPVKGQMAWCQGCGHGGHHRCCSTWFRSSSKCPTGCSHICLQASKTS